LVIIRYLINNPARQKGLHCRLIRRLFAACFLLPFDHCRHPCLPKHLTFLLSCVSLLRRPGLRRKISAILWEICGNHQACHAESAMLRAIARLLFRKRAPSCRSQFIRTCSGTPAAICWRIRASIRGRCKLISATRTSSTPFAIPKWRRIGLGTFGETDAGNILAGGLGVVLISVVVAYLTPHPTLASRVASIEEVQSCRCPPHQFRYSRLVSTRSRRSSTRPRPMPKPSRSPLRGFSMPASSPTCLNWPLRCRAPAPRPRTEVHGSLA